MDSTSLNQFRRDPVSGQWSIILHDESTLEALLQAKPKIKLSEKPSSCMYCEGREKETPAEIFAIRSSDSEKDGPGWLVRVLPNRQPFLQISGDLNNRGIGLYDVLDGIGAHEVVLESPTPNERLYEMSVQQIQNIFLAYRERILDLKRDHRFRYIMVHKNYEEFEDDLDHHSQSDIIATPITPARAKAELVNAMEHYKLKERCLFCDIIYQELSDVERVIFENEFFVALAPFASRVPFSVWILPKAHETFFEWNTETEQLAEIISALFAKLALVLHDPPFVMVLHTGPNTATAIERGYWKTLENDYHWYIEITPQFNQYKSFEIGSGFQVNAVSPERAAVLLQNGNHRQLAKTDSNTQET